jgi:hypothetical protein
MTVWISCAEGWGGPVAPLVRDKTTAAHGFASKVL